MNEDSYLDASYEDRYDYPDYDLPDYRDEEEEAYWDHFLNDPDEQSSEDDDFPMYLEYDEGYGDAEPPF